MIGIIAVLIGILLPAMAAARGQSQVTKCKANLHSIYQALVMYANDNNDRFPGPLTLGNFSYRTAPGRTMPGRSDLQESYGLPALLHGIEPGKQPVLPLPKPRYISGESEVWICPSAPEQFSRYGNTYWWTANKNVATMTSLQRHRATIKTDGYNNTDYNRVVYLMDNTTSFPGLTGFIGPFSGSSGSEPYNIPAGQKVYAHTQYKRGYKGAFNNLALNGEIVTQLVK